jgi:MFS transporter, Spinster family, sphingosine-1-phosphate transporter
MASDAATAGEMSAGRKVTSAGWYALTLISAVQMMSLLDRQILSILATNIREDLQIGDAELGLLYGTVFALFYSLFSLPLGRLADGWVRTRLLAICLSVWSFATLLGAFAGGFALLALARLGVGIGEAAGQPAGYSLICDHFPKEKRGIATAAMAIAVALGLGLSMVIGGVAAGWWDARYPAGNAPGGFRGWQFAFIVAALPGFLLAWLVWRMKEPKRGVMDGIISPEDPHPFRASAAMLAAVTPGANWWMLWQRNAGAAQWATNLVALAIITGFVTLAVTLANGFSPRPPLAILGLSINPHLLQWTVVGIGLFVILNLFQSFKLSDAPTYAVLASPSLILLMVVGGLQTAINYGVMGFTPSFIMREFGLSPAATGLQFGLLSAALGVLGPVIAGPLTDLLNRHFSSAGRIGLVILSLGITPLIAMWVYTATDAGSFYLRFSIYSLILTMWMPPLYSALMDLVLPRMRGMTFSTYTIIMTILGLGIGPYLVGMVSDANGGRLGPAILSVNFVAPLIIALLVIVMLRIRKDEESAVARARAAGEKV